MRLYQSKHSDNADRTQKLKGHTETPWLSKSTGPGDGPMKTCLAADFCIRS